MAWRVMIPKKIPAMFSHEYPVGVMCRVIRWLSGFAGHLQSLGASPSVVVQHDMQPCAGMGGGGPLRKRRTSWWRRRGRQAFAVAFPVAICRATTSAASISGILPGPRLILQRGESRPPARRSRPPARRSRPAGSGPTSVGYSHQGQELSNHPAELRKHPQVAQRSPHLLGAGHIKRFRRSAVVHSQARDESRLAGTVGREAPCHPGNRRVRRPFRFQHTTIGAFRPFESFGSE